MQRIDASAAAPAGLQPVRPAPRKAASRAGDPARGLVRLLSFVLPGPVLVEGEGAEVLLRRDAERRRVERALLTLCIRRGLLMLEKGRLTALPPARPLLRRLISGGETAFLAQHARLENARLGDGEGQETAVLVNRHESALGALALLKDKAGEPWFDAQAIAAGERLSADFTFAGLQPRVTASWEPRLSGRAGGGRGGQAELSDHQADARARVARAADALGPELSGVAFDVCCFGKGLEQVERERLWPARSAKLMLRTALSLLARHYGL